MLESIGNWIERFSGLIAAFGILILGWLQTKNKTDSEVSKTKTDEFITIEKWKKEQVSELIQTCENLEKKAERFEYMYYEMKKLNDEYKKEIGILKRQVNVFKNLQQ